MDKKELAKFVLGNTVKYDMKAEFNGKNLIFSSTYLTGDDDCYVHEVYIYVDPEYLVNSLKEGKSLLEIFSSSHIQVFAWEDKDYMPSQDLCRRKGKWLVYS